MEVKPIEVYSEATNVAVVRMPGRQYPGSVIQGDSLAILCGNARSILQRVRNLSDEELVGDAEELVELLSGRLRHYEEVLKAHGFSLPY